MVPASATSNTVLGSVENRVAVGARDGRLGLVAWRVLVLGWVAVISLPSAGVSPILSLIVGVLWLGNVVAGRVLLSSTVELAHHLVLICPIIQMSRRHHLVSLLIRCLLAGVVKAVVGVRILIAVWAAWRVHVRSLVTRVLL